MNVTEITQLEPAANDVPQALVSAKALAFVPPSVIPAIASGALPVFESVTGIAAAVLPMTVPGNVMLAGERLATGAIPVPASVVVCGEPAALSATLNVAVYVVAAAAVKVTEITQLEPAANDVPQALVSAKAFAFAPPIVTLLIASGALPVFDSVTGTAVAVLPMAVPGNVTAVGERLARGAVPVPVRVTVCGEPDTLSETVMAAEKLAAEAGVNVAEILQLNPAASVEPQPLVIAKSAAFVPPRVTLAIFSVEVPGFESVVEMAADVEFTVVLGNDSVVGESIACGAMPVPVRDAVWGDPVALSATLRNALKVVADAGVKLTEILQLNPAASDEPQALVSAKSPGLAPVRLMPVMVREAVPGLESTTTCVLLVVLTAWFPKGTAVGVSTACGVPAMPVPLRLTICGLLGSPSVSVSVPACVPVPLGVKVTLTVHEADAASEVPQLSVSLYCVLAAMLVKAMAVVPVLVTVTGCEALVVDRT